MANAPLFGLNADPSLNELKNTYRIAEIADQNGLDLLMIQDHPYNRRFLDTWTLLTALAMKTERVHVGTNVANLPLRPPAMLAKSVATLDVLSNQRARRTWFRRGRLLAGDQRFWRANAHTGRVLSSIRGSADDYARSVESRRTQMLLANRRRMDCEGKWG